MGDHEEKSIALVHNLLRNMNWAEKSEVVDLLIEQHGSLTISPLTAGLEAEVAKISTDDAGFVLKVWNRGSKPDVGYQFKLLKTMYARGLSVSEPLGWGVDQDNNSVLLTGFDGFPITKLNLALVRRIAAIQSGTHKFPVEHLGEINLPKHDFIGYFFPAIDDHPDIKHLLEQLVAGCDLQQNALIHGDYNLGNILENEGKLTIIDWTNGQLGDPRYDLAWSAVLLKIYASERLARHYAAAYLAEIPYTEEELERFEAIACLRWILLNRVADLPKGKDTRKRVKSLLKGNPYLNESLL